MKTFQNHSKSINPSNTSGRETRTISAKFSGNERPFSAFNLIIPTRVCRIKRNDTHTRPPYSHTKNIIFETSNTGKFIMRTPARGCGRVINSADEGLSYVNVTNGFGACVYTFTNGRCGIWRFVCGF